MYTKDAFCPVARGTAMVRSLAVLLFFCLSAQPVFASNANLQERVQRFSQYVSKLAIAQSQRMRVLGLQSKSFNSRVQGYVRVLEMQARPFQTKFVPTAAQN